MPVGPRRSVLALAVAKTDLAKNDAPTANALYDTGAATALLSVEAPHAGWVDANF